MYHAITIHVNARLRLILDLQQLEADLAVHTEKVKSLSTKAKQLVQDGHFDSVTINKKSQKLERE